MRAHLLAILGSSLTLLGCGPSEPRRADEVFRAFAAAPMGEEADALGRELIDLGEEAVLPLTRALKDGDHHVRARAAWALGEIRSPAAIPFLVACFQDPEDSVRESAAQALGRVGDPAAPIVAPYLADADVRVRRAAAKALWASEAGGRLVFPQLLAALEREQDEDVFSALCFALEECGEGAAPALPILLARLEHRSPHIVWSAQYALGRMGAWVAGPLRSALHDTSSVEVGSALVYALGELKDAEAVPLLLEAARHGHADMRLSAAHALGKIQGPPATVVPVLTSLVGDPVEFVRKAAIDALRKSGPDAGPAVPALLARYPLESEAIQGEIVWALGAIGPAAAEAIPILLPRLGSPAWGGRVLAIQALAAIGREVPEASATLVEALRDEDDTVRSSAAIALRTVDPKRFREMGSQLVPHLLEATHRTDHDQMRRALQALSDLGPVAGDALPELRAWRQRCERQVAEGEAGLGDYAGRRVRPAVYRDLISAAIRSIEGGA